jgi:integrase
MRGEGKIYNRPGSKFWWICYSLRGKLYRESTRTTDEKKAQKFLKHRIKEIGADQIGAKKFIGPIQERVTVGDLLDALERDYEIRGKKTPPVCSHLKPIRSAFADWRAIDVTEQAIDDYIQDRRNANKTDATVNRETQLLSQAYALGRKKVGEAPEIRRLSEKNAREGFFERADFEPLVKELPEAIQDFARFGYLTGWRKGEIASLTWAEFEMDSRMMRLRGRASKNGEPRKVPLEGDLWEIIERRWNARAVKMPTGETFLADLVFHRRGAPVKDFKKAWKSACRTAGVEGKLFHDFRRTAVRNMRRAGVSEKVAMEISGHKTRSIFDRYDITDERDLREAIRKTQEYLRATPSERTVTPFRKASGDESQ